MSERRRALGRGLGALISSERGTTPTAVPASPESPLPPQTHPTHNSVYEEEPSEPLNSGFSAGLPVNQIDPNPDQPRRRFDPSELERLAASILQHGVLQPVVVRKVADRYELIVGERRWRASRAAGLTSIPAVIADLAAKERLEVAIVENVQRNDLNPLELAYAYRALAAAGATQEEIGKKVSQDRSSVANHLRLLELSRDIQEDLEQGRLRMGHAKALLQIAEDAGRDRLRDRIIKEGLSVRAAEKLARRVEDPKGAGGDTQGQPLDPNITRSLEALQNRFQARVRLQGGGKKGRIEIDYFDSEDFQRIFSLLMDGA
ncbi:MAG TPA: ParB/RepB/Spo0J family partition protein [Myxococcales bacterium]|nr:ParB/RepB/Spo0J family partition protein [Myxococcales bacterium]